jgi:glc operon protein GlcG
MSTIQRFQQAPANPPSGGIPDQIPFDIPYASPISLERAKFIVGAAEAEARKRNWKVSIAVVDPNGDLIYFVRMDDAMVASVAVSISEGPSFRPFPTCNAGFLQRL